MKLVPKVSSPAAGPVVEKLTARIAHVGEGDGGVVRRLLPGTRRTIGAWCFLDHFGPMPMRPGEMQVAPHPHIGLQTVTWLLEGEVTHLDTLGSRQVIRPGQLNWMTAGSGIAHGEEGVFREGGRAHGVQLWVALPDAVREGPPAFDHHPEVPRIALDGATGSLLVGSLAGAKAEARTFSPLLAAQLDLAAGATVVVPVDPEFEHGVAAIVGEVEVEGAPVAVGELVHLGRRRTTVTLRAREAATAFLLGGTPFEEPLLMWWNFVARTDAEIRDARARWEAGQFGPVPGAAWPPLSAPPLG